jgi:hypothetical protein
VSGDPGVSQDEPGGSGGTGGGVSASGGAGGSLMAGGTGGSVVSSGGAGGTVSPTGGAGGAGAVSGSGGSSAGAGPTCAAGMVMCAGSCADTQTDAANCGSCGNACAPGQSCTAGACACQAGLNACPSGCVDTMGDGANCGACGNACAAGQVCSGGACASGCAEGLTQCSASCVNVTNNPQHCGACGTACGAGTSCTNGACACPTGQSQCSGRCIDTSADSSNCGACGNACAPGRICRMGACSCPTGQTDCSGTCADLKLSNAHCGTCGNACGTGVACTMGTCTCTGGKAACSGACVDVSSYQTDRNNCGACGTKCSANQICSGGKCGTGSGSCSGNVTVNANPLGCELAWGANGNAGSRSSYLDFITSWVGDENNGGLNGECGECALVRSLAGTNARVGYYGYFIGFQANKQAGYGDCNTDMDGQTLCTRGGAWIKANRASIIQMYANYARMTHEANPNRGVLWLLEGDFIQYTRSSQSSPLTLQEAGQLTNDIICAIKSNQPTAWVAMNHSTWNSDQETRDFWAAMPLNVMDFIWTTGAGNANGFLTQGTTASSYNGATAKFSYIHSITGKKIFVDTSFGASQQADSWSDQSAATLNARIADGVFAVNVTSPPADSTFQSRINALGSLSSTCN